MDQPRFARRMNGVRPSFIREILKAAEDSGVISLAGGLPSPSLFPVEDLAVCAARVLAEDGSSALQYGATQGHGPLREWVAARCAARGVRVEADEILITTGSQQALDLLGRVFLDPGDRVAVEAPGYLGALQALGAYEPRFCPVPLNLDGGDPAALRRALRRRPKLYYAVPNFQNPSGLTYSEDCRRCITQVLRGCETLLVEDDPYGELRFEGRDLPPLAANLEGRGVLLGSFSKTVAPGLRLGWVAAPRAVLSKLVIAKQGADLHSSPLAQRILHRYLTECDVEAHLARLQDAYRQRRDRMCTALGAHLPSGTSWTRPEGGMFLWLTLPPGVSAQALLEEAVAQGVTFVPGSSFHVDGSGAGKLRLNFSHPTPERIDEGIARLGRALQRLLAPSPDGRRRPAPRKEEIEPCQG